MRRASRVPPQQPHGNRPTHESSAPHPRYPQGATRTPRASPVEKRARRTPRCHVPPSLTMRNHLPLTPHPPVALPPSPRTSGTPPPEGPPRGAARIEHRSSPPPPGNTGTGSALRLHAVRRVSAPRKAISDRVRQEFPQTKRPTSPDSASYPWAAPTQLAKVRSRLPLASGVTPSTVCVWPVAIGRCGPYPPPQARSQSTRCHLSRPHPSQHPTTPPFRLYPKPPSTSVPGVSPSLCVTFCLRSPHPHSFNSPRPPNMPYPPCLNIKGCVFLEVVLRRRRAPPELPGQLLWLRQCLPPREWVRVRSARMGGRRVCPGRGRIARCSRMPMKA